MEINKDYLEKIISEGLDKGEADIGSTAFNILTEHLYNELCVVSRVV